MKSLLSAADLKAALEKATQRFDAGDYTGCCLTCNEILQIGWNATGIGLRAKIQKLYEKAAMARAR